MKKRLAILLSIVMILSCTLLAACGGGGSSEDLSDSKYVGTWKAESLSFGGESGDIEGGTYILTLNGDGTGSFTSTADDGEVETSDIKWSLTDDGFKTTGDTKLTFTDDGDGIKASILGMDLHFVREGAADSGETAEADETSETADQTSVAAGDENGYTGTDPVIREVYDYLADEIAENYYGVDDDVVESVPVVTVIDQYEGDNGETIVKGDFWVFNYKVEGDTLKCISGGSHPGAIHLVKDDDDNEYDVVGFDAVGDGSEFEPTAREIFGDKYDAFAKVNSDSDAREALRTQTLAAYVKAHNLPVTKYQDEGWDPVDLPL